MGRSRELAELRGWLGQAWTGCGRVVLVGGLAGIGKTRLAEEAATTAEMSAGVVWGRAVDDAGVPPWWPWQRVVSHAAHPWHGGSGRAG